MEAIYLSSRCFKSDNDSIKFKNSKVKNKIFNVGSDKENYRIKDIIKELKK